MKKLLFLALGLALQPAFADRLLVISSGLGMYGDDDNINIGVEKFGANLVEEALKHKYDKVYKVITAEAIAGDRSISYTAYEDQMKAAIENIKEEIQEGEKLDVFTMQHGPAGTPFDNLSFDEADIPHGMIRNVYSTACNEFGDAVIKSAKEVIVTDYNSAFSDSLEEVGVENYLYHVNMNGTGAFTLPLLLKEFAKTNNWAEAGRKAFAEFDKEMAALIPGIQGLRSNETLNKIMPGFKGATYGWEDILTSRLVIGEKNFTRMRSKDRSNLKSDVYNIQSNNNYMKNIVPLAPELEKIVGEYCPEGFYDGADCDTVEPEMKLTEAVKIFLDRFANVFAAYDPSENACLPGAVVNGFLGAIGQDIKVKELCLRKKSESRYKLVWKLEKDHLLDLRKEIELPIDELKRVNIATRGEIMVHLAGDKIRARLRGVKIIVNGIDGQGKLHQVTRFRPNGINIYESGRIEGRVKVLGIPLTGGVEEKTVDEIDMIDFFKLFGFRIYLEKLGINL